MGELQIPPDARRTRTAIIFRDRFLRLIFVERAEVELADAKEAIAISNELFANGPALPVYVDMRRLRSQSAEARVFFANPDGIMITPAVGMVVASPLSRVIGNFFIGLNHPPAPTRIFNDVDAADAWLAGFLRNENVA